MVELYIKLFSSHLCSIITVEAVEHSDVNYGGDQERRLWRLVRKYADLLNQDETFVDMSGLMC